MELTIKGTTKEIADFVLEIQNQPQTAKIYSLKEALDGRITALEGQAQERYEIAVMAIRVMQSFVSCFDIEVEGLIELTERYLN